MSPQHRADMVCRNADELSELRSQIESYKTTIAQKRENIARGYAIHRECHDVRVPDSRHDDRRRDSRGKKHDGRDHGCKTVQRCREIPVPINVSGEQEIADRMQHDVIRLEHEYNRLYGDCYRKVLDMGPEEAYRYFDHNRLP